jgi:hypothetical protein
VEATIGGGVGSSSPDNMSDDESREAELMSIDQIEARLELLRQQYRFHAKAVRRLSPRKREPKMTQMESLVIHDPAWKVAEAAIDESGDGGRRSNRASKRPKHYIGDTAAQNQGLDVAFPFRTDSPTPFGGGEGDGASDDDGGAGVAGSAAATPVVAAAVPVAAAVAVPSSSPSTVEEPKVAKKAAAKPKALKKETIKETKAMPEKAKSESKKKTKKDTAKETKAAKEKAAPADGDEQQDGPIEIFTCPWPGCDRTFDRIKSRSAHLKWHGGNYKGSNGGSEFIVGPGGGGGGGNGKDDADDDADGSAKAGGGTAKEKEEPSAKAEGKKRTASESGSVCGGGPKKDKKQRQRSSGSVSPPTTLTVGAKVIMPAGDHAGKVGVVSKIEEDAQVGRVYHIILTACKGKSEKSRTVQVAAADFETNGTAKVEFKQGMLVFGRSITAKGPAFRKGKIEGVRVDGSLTMYVKQVQFPPEQFGLVAHIHAFLPSHDRYKFVPNDDDEQRVWLPPSDLIVDEEPQMSQLRTGTSYPVLNELMCLRNCYESHGLLSQPSPPPLT